MVKTDNKKYNLNSEMDRSILSLPNEVLTEILKYVDTLTMGQLVQSCQQLNMISDQRLIKPRQQSWMEAHHLSKVIEPLMPLEKYVPQEFILEQLRKLTRTELYSIIKEFSRIDQNLLNTCDIKTLVLMAHTSMFSMTNMGGFNSIWMVSRRKLLFDYFQFSDKSRQHHLEKVISSHIDEYNQTLEISYGYDENKPFDYFIMINRRGKNLALSMQTKIHGKEFILLSDGIYYVVLNGLVPKRSSFHLFGDQIESMWVSFKDYWNYKVTPDVLRRSYRSKRQVELLVWVGANPQMQMKIKANPGERIEIDRLFQDEDIIDCLFE